MSTAISSASGNSSGKAVVVDTRVFFEQQQQQQQQQHIEDSPAPAATNEKGNTNNNITTHHPITEAYIRTERRYKRARNCMKKMTQSISTMRNNMNTGFHSIMEDQFQMMETDIIRHNEQMRQVEQTFQRSKNDLLFSIQDMINLYDGFRCFLHGFHERAASPLLCMLNQGPETTTSIKRHIANFLGVPSGIAVGDYRAFAKELRCHQRRNNKSRPSRKKRKESDR